MLLPLYERLLLGNRVSRFIRDLGHLPHERVLDLGSGSHPDYHRFLCGRTIRADRVIGAAVDLICDGHDLPLKGALFDKALCINALYYFDDPARAIRELGRVLKKDGEVILVVPFLYPIHDVPADKYRFTEHGVRALLQGHFHVDRISPIGGIFSLPALLLYALIKGTSKKFAKEVLAWFFSPLFLLCLGIRCLDFLDRTKRWPMLYFVVARRR